MAWDAVTECDVCFLLDGDERQKPTIFCPKCDANICEICQVDSWRRFRAMLKRTTRKFFHRIMFTTSLLAILAVVGICQAPPPSQFEVPCPSGSSPLLPNGWTLDPTTNKYRAWACVAADGSVTIIGGGSGGSPAGNINDVQFNLDGVSFGGDDQTIRDPSGSLLISPTPTGHTGDGAIEVFGDSSSDDVADFFITGLGVPNVWITTDGALNVIPTNTFGSVEPSVAIEGDADGNDILDAAQNGQNTFGFELFPTSGDPVDLTALWVNNTNQSMQLNATNGLLAEVANVIKFSISPSGQVKDSAGSAGAQGMVLANNSGVSTLWSRIITNTVSTNPFEFVNTDTGPFDEVVADLCPNLPANGNPCAHYIGSALTPGDAAAWSYVDNSGSIYGSFAIFGFGEAARYSADQYFRTTLNGTITACANSASPALCGANANGFVAIPTGTASETLQINTTAVTANSQIFLQADATLGGNLTLTCDSSITELVGGLAVTARTPGSSFTIVHVGNITTDALCLSYRIEN